ncbi:NEDD4-binding protein 3-A-like [Salvelinus sp. IW2-2015]|uniref:NEDD4-binding protein 3-A-like n=1 Tax=Salvelinus sp. IW2-2015 TaxID=2691554 RepID=UPI0038D42C81
MATSVQTLPLSRDPSKTFRDPYSTPTRPTALLARCSMGSVGSLVEHPDASPAKGSRAVPQVGPRQTNRLLKKGFNQRELLNYLNITRKEAKAGSGPGSSRKDIFSSMQSMNREHGHEEEHIKLYYKDGTEVDVSKNSLPIGGKYEKVRRTPGCGTTYRGDIPGTTYRGDIPGTTYRADIPETTYRDDIPGTTYREPPNHTTPHNTHTHTTTTHTTHTHTHTHTQHANHHQHMTSVTWARHFLKCCRLASIQQFFKPNS